MVKPFATLTAKNQIHSLHRLEMAGGTRRGWEEKDCWDLSTEKQNI